MAGVELMVPPTVETGEESVVAAPGFFWSSFRRCSLKKSELSVTNRLIQIFFFSWKGFMIFSEDQWFNSVPQRRQSFGAFGDSCLSSYFLSFSTVVAEHMM